MQIVRACISIFLNVTTRQREKVEETQQLNCVRREFIKSALLFLTCKLLGGTM